MRWLIRLLSRFDRNRPDMAWRATGTRYTTDRTYDYDKARLSFLKAQTRSETGRVWKKAKPQAPATVTPIRRAK